MSISFDSITLILPQIKSEARHLSYISFVNTLAK